MEGVTVVPHVDERSAEAGEQPPKHLSVRGLRKSFDRTTRRSRETVHVLSDITFSVDAGEFVTLIGPSGCGKSTLLNCIAGLSDWDAGSISFEGEEITGPGVERAFVFQHASLLPWRTVSKNVSYGLELRRQSSRAEVAARTAAALELVGLAAFAQHYPHEISGGMQQRVNLARALVLEPEMLLMDEPFGALDALTKETLQDELLSLAGRTRRTTLFVTHDIQEAVYLADKVIVMSPRPGRIVAQIDVPFAYPRSREVTEVPEFIAIERQLRAMVRGEEGADAR
ncbi:MAG: ABC transporter ATP-binding protein [Microbacterium sp.]|uniref:ABC transporter ATP-binding protein n=1 Tax=Microbacterium sp. TaxID=51671 RepID=UPI0039E59CFD